MPLITLNSCRKVVDTDQTNDLALWPVLRWANEEFLRSVEKFYVYGEWIECALLFTHDRKVYAQGENLNGRLGVGFVGAVTEPTEVVELRDKHVVQCTSGGFQDVFLMVLTTDGDLYGWGENGHGQIGCGNFEDQLRPVVVMRNVQMVACGDSHTAALCRDGTVWCWGSNQEYLGLDNVVQCSSPVQVVSALSGQRVVHIDCGVYICLALTNEARLYIWGYFEESIEVCYPDQVPLCSVHSVVSVAVGKSCFLTLSSDGRVHYCRYDKKDTFQCDLVKLDEPVQAVVSWHGGWTFYLKLQSGRVVVWSEATVTLTSLTSMADACVLYNWEIMSCIYSHALTTLPANTIDDLRSLTHFQNPKTTDLTVYVGFFGDKPIYLNRQNTSQFSSYFAAQIQGRWKNEETSFIRGYKFVVWFTLFRYLHTGTVGVIEPQWTDQLLELALRTKTPYLQDLCLHMITTHIPNGITKFLQTQYWLAVRKNLKTSLTVTNCRYYLQLAEAAGDEALHNQICLSMAKQSLSTAHALFQHFGGLSEDSQSALLPEQYLQWMTRYSDDRGLLELLQDSCQGPFFSRYLASNMNIDNCILHFWLADEAQDMNLQNEVVRFVSSLDNPWSLCGTDGYQQADSDLIKFLFSQVFLSQELNQNTTAKRKTDDSFSGSDHKRHMASSNHNLSQ